MRLGAYSIDFRKLVEDAIEPYKVRRAIEDLEMRYGALNRNA